MSNNKQSSVEWLQAIELERDLTLADWNKAKAMHKEEIMKAYGEEKPKRQNDGSWKLETSKQYYNETFQHSDNSLDARNFGNESNDVFQGD